MKNSLNRRYPFGHSPELPAKTSVTALTHRNDEYFKPDYSKAFDRRPHALITAELESKEILESRLIGTATHLVISRLDLTEPPCEKTVTQTIEKLLADKAITTTAAENINTDSIITFFKSELGRLLFETGNKVMREWPFTFTITAYESGRVAATEQSEVDGPSTSLHSVAATRQDTSNEIRDMIIVQGIIDLLIQTPKGLVIVDFKTDKISTAQADKRAEFYRRQLELYGRAASDILKIETSSKWLYFLTPGVPVEVRR